MKTYIIMLKSHTNQDILNYFRNRDVVVIWKDQEVLTKSVVVETNHSIEELEKMMYVELVKEVLPEQLAQANM